MSLDMEVTTENFSQKVVLPVPPLDLSPLIKDLSANSIQECDADAMQEQKEIGKEYHIGKFGIA